VSPPPFQRFLDAHAEEVWRFLVAGGGRPAPHDCFQETFLSAMRAYPKMRPDNPRAWVLTIAHRKALDHFRARKRRAVPVGDDLPEVAAPPAPDPRDDGVWARVRALPPKQRAAVLLRFAGDLSHREVAAALGVSEEAARRNAFEGLRRLRQELTA
jgi:RNA polymerase sigma factor (sigma-70 family)